MLQEVPQPETVRQEERMCQGLHESTTSPESQEPTTMNTREIQHNG